MFALGLEDLINLHQTKTQEGVLMLSVLHYLVPNAEYGFSPTASGDIETETDYAELHWLDPRTQPTWSELQAAIPAVFELEKNLDLDQIRKLRYQTTALTYEGMQFEASPAACSLLSELIAGAESLSGNVVSILDFNRQPISLPLPVAKDLQLALRQKLQQWINNPIIE